MFAATYLLAGLLVAVDTGWQPLEGGGYEYIIQIEPELMDAIKAGEEFTSDIPPTFRDVRSFRIRYGTGAVPRIGDPTAAPAESPGAVKPAAAEVPVDKPAGEPKPLPKNLTSIQQPGVGGYIPKMAAEKSPDKDATAGEKPKLPATAKGSDSATDAGQQIVEAGFGERADPNQSFTPNTNSTVSTLGKGLGSPASKSATPKTGGEEESPSDRKSGLSNTNRGTSRGAGSSAVDDAEKPWWPLTLTAFGLFISLGGNAYLGMMAWELRERCQSLLRNKAVRAAGSYDPASYIPSKSNYGAAVDDEDQDVRAVDDSQSWRTRRA